MSRMFIYRILQTICFISLIACIDNVENTESKSTTGNVTLPEPQSSARQEDSIYTWSEGLCEYKGTLDPSKYSKDELENTWNLTLGGQGLGDVINYFSDEHYVPTSINTVNSQYKKALASLTELKIVKNNKYWKDLRRQRILELNDEYKLKTITIEAYTNPSVLLKNDFTDSCLFYASALASGDTASIFSAWRQLHSENLKRNGAPEILEEKFLARFNSPDKLKYAKSDLMGSGWWNCANHQILHLENDGKWAREFAKLFIKVQEECDED